MPFKPDHLTVILLTTLVTILLIYFRNKSGTKHFKPFLVFLFVFHIFYFYIGNFVLKSFSFPYSLPFHLCSISFYLVFLALILKNTLLKQVAVFWGSASAVLAILLPDMRASFPEFKFIEFFISHLAIFWGTIYLVYIEKTYLNYKSLWKALGLLAVYAYFAQFLNIIWKGNFLYIHSPEGLPSIFPPAPFHIPVLIVATIAIFHLEYIIFRSNKPKAIK